MGAALPEGVQQGVQLPLGKAGAPGLDPATNCLPPSRQLQPEPWDEQDQVQADQGAEGDQGEADHVGGAAEPGQRKFKTKLREEEARRQRGGEGRILPSPLNFKLSLKYSSVDILTDCAFILIHVPVHIAYIQTFYA